jgi:hypothetical protein
MERFVDNLSRKLATAVSRREMLSITSRAMLGAIAAGPLLALDARTEITDPGIYFDSNHLLVQRDGDGGDTAQREGWAWFGNWLRTVKLKMSSPFVPPISFAATMDLLEDPKRPGEFRRHPTQPGFKSDPDAFSRDQLIPLVAAMGVMGDLARLKRSWAAKRPCHFIFTCVQGTQDVLGPDLVNLYRRAWGEAPDPSGDKALALGVADRLRQANQNPEDVGDDLNLIVQLLMAKVCAPSADTELAITAYAKNRAVCAGCYLSHYRAANRGNFTADEKTMIKDIRKGVARGWKTDCPRVLGALRWYFRAESGGCSTLAELYEPMVNRWLS